MPLLEQKSYLLGCKIYPTILKNHMQETLDAIIGENQSATIKTTTILHIFFTIQDVIDVSYKLNSNLALISMNSCEPFKE